MLNALKNNWPNYLIEAWCLGTFMVSACVFAALLFNPRSPFISINFEVRNIVMGVAMGSTAIGLITSPWGRRSGAHFNPAVTLTFLRLGKIDRSDAGFYILFQFLGGAAGVWLSWLMLGDLLMNGAVNFVVTVPGNYGPGAAFTAEFFIAFLVMTMILFTGNAGRAARFTPFIAGGLIAFFIAVESPVSGMSINPARTFASAVVAREWTGWWIYFSAPPLAMLAAAELFLRIRELKSVGVATLDRSGPGHAAFGSATNGTERTGKVSRRQTQSCNPLSPVCSVTKSLENL